MKTHGGRFMKAMLLTGGIACGILPVAPDRVRAQTESENSPGSTPAWEFELTPYVWLAGIEGHARVGEFSSGGIEASFADLFASMQGGLMGVFEARRGRWGGTFDGLYISLSKEAAIEFPAGGAVDADLKQQLYEGTLLYRAFERAGGTLDILAGARYLDVEFDATVEDGIFDGRAAGNDESWVNAFLGVRGTYAFARSWSVGASVDAGAGGSNLSWQALAGVRCQFTGMFSGRAGYRHLAYDFERQNIAYDVTLGGPYLALGIRF